MKKIKHYIKKIWRFLLHNHRKGMYLRALWLSARYRIMIKCYPMTYVEKYLGARGEESAKEESIENLRYAYTVGRITDKICSHTPWESKCFVRALTAQHLLKSKHIESTTYLGCGKDGEKLIAHAWLRCGQLYVSGGDGKEFSMVAKFRA